MWNNIEEVTKDRLSVKYEGAERFKGSGKLRIGRKFMLREDCYGLVVLSMLQSQKLNEALKFEEKCLTKVTIDPDE